MVGGGEGKSRFAEHRSKSDSPKEAAKGARVWCENTPGPQPEHLLVEILHREGGRTRDLPALCTLGVFIYESDI